MTGVGVPFGAEQEDDGVFVEAHGLAIVRVVHDRQEGTHAGGAGLTGDHRGLVGAGMRRLARKVTSSWQRR